MRRAWLTVVGLVTGCAAATRPPEPVAVPRARLVAAPLTAAPERGEISDDPPPSAAEVADPPELQPWRELSCVPFEYDALLHELRDADGLALYQRDAFGKLLRHDLLGEPCAHARAQRACRARSSPPPSAAGKRWLATFGERVKWIDPRGALGSLEWPIDRAEEAVTVAVLHGLPVECTAYTLRLVVAESVRGFAVRSSDPCTATSSMFVARDGAVEDVSIASLSHCDE